MPDTQPAAIYSRYNRRRVDPACEFGHRWQAMECPSCTERLTGEKPPADWWAWYRRRYPKRKAKEVKDG